MRRRVCAIGVVQCLADNKHGVLLLRVDEQPRPGASPLLRVIGFFIMITCSVLFPVFE